jgi:hypothetical protein
MKRILLMMTFVLCASCAVWADTACPTSPSADLSTYDVSGFACTVGDLTFSNFAYSAAADGGAVAPTDAGITVIPVTTGPEIGLTFQSGWLVGSTELEDSLITYTVTCTGCSITDIDLTTVGSFTGTGDASVAETGSETGFPTMDQVNLSNAFTGGSTVQDDSATIGPVGSLTLKKDIGVVGGTAGSAHISAVSNLFSTDMTAVPEPSALFLCMGLLGFVPIARRKFGI